MSAIPTPPQNEWTRLLEALEAADASLRCLYRNLADNPDLAAGYEAGLRELHAKRMELAGKVGLAALADWRLSRTAGPTPSAETLAEAPIALEPESEAPTSDSAGADPAPQSDTDEPIAEAEASLHPPPAPVSARQLEEFIASLATAASPARAPPQADDRSLLLGLAAHVSIGAHVATSGAWEVEVDQLERASSEERMKRWRGMTREAQVRWLSALVSWAKALEQDGVRLGEPNARVAAVFRELRAFSMNDAPGFVHGFARTAMPKSASWRLDAHQVLREVRPGPLVPTAVKSTRLPKVVEQADQDERESDPLSDWPLRDRVRGLRVVLFGGEPKEERRVALERAFQFESLEWIPRNRPRLVASLAERASRGTVDFVLVTKFVSHKETVAIARASVAPMLTMRHGYGVTTVRQVFEEHFLRQDGGVAAVGDDADGD